jgi:hypothetical protein
MLSNTPVLGVIIHFDVILGCRGFGRNSIGGFGKQLGVYG